MAIGLQALFTLVLVHLETALLFKITHGDKRLRVVKRKGSEKHFAYDAVKRIF
jgi:hypothetical protein